MALTPKEAKADPMQKGSKIKTVKWLPLKAFPVTLPLADNVTYMFSSSGVKTIMITVIMIIIKTIIIVKVTKKLQVYAV